jgi:hypothetical protein
LTKGRIKSGQRRLDILSLVCSIHRLEDPQLFDQLGVFALWGSKSNIVIMSLFIQYQKLKINHPSQRPQWQLTKGLKWATSKA